jgi:hypothetical protein
MANFNIYSNRGFASMVPGNLVRSDSRSRNCIYRQPVQLYAATAINFNNFGAPGSNQTITFTNNTTSEVVSFSYVAPLILSIDNVFNVVAPQVPAGYSVKLNPIGNIEFYSTVPGSLGNFLTTTALIGTTGNNLVSVAATPPLLVGRFLVPEPNYIEIGAGVRTGSTPFRYPQLGDGVSTISAGVFSIKDAHCNYNMSLNGINLQDGGMITAGTPFAGLYRGEMIIQAISQISNPSNQLYVESVNAGTALQGRITNVPTGTTIAIPNGKLAVIAGATGANALSRISIQY